jgi:hypothetical protein
MALFFVSFESVQDKSRLALCTRLDRYDAKRIMTSVFAIQGDYSTAEIRNDLRDCINSESRLLVIESASWSGRKLLSHPPKL